MKEINGFTGSGDKNKRDEAFEIVFSKYASPPPETPEFNPNQLRSEGYGSDGSVGFGHLIVPTTFLFGILFGLYIGISHK